MKSIFIALTVCFSSTVFSQKYVESEKLNLIQKNGIEITNSDLKNLNECDFELIKNYDFDNYRNEKSDRQIQLVRGPKVIVKSFLYCKENQISFDENIYTSKKNEVENKKSKNIITQLNIGLGIQRVERLN